MAADPSDDLGSRLTMPADLRPLVSSSARAWEALPLSADRARTVCETARRDRTVAGGYDDAAFVRRPGDIAGDNRSSRPGGIVALHESGSGTNAKCRRGQRTSGYWGRADL